jgi:hypothetical protein
MEKKKSTIVKTEFLDEIKNLYSKYKEKVQCGIFFKLGKGKSPLEVIGVLNFLKFKFKKWRTKTIFTYLGKFFDENIVIVIGARNYQDAHNIMISVYLSEILKKPNKIYSILEMVQAENDLELYIKSEVSENLKTGYPPEKEIEIQIIKHLEKIIEE